MPILRQWPFYLFSLLFLTACANLPAPTPKHKPKVEEINQPDPFDTIFSEPESFSKPETFPPNPSEPNPLPETKASLEVHPADIWDRIRQGYGMKTANSNRRIAHQRNWYASHPDYLNRVIKRAQPYLYYVVSELDKRGMPMELALLPIVESAYDPFAYSRSQASGLWQFIPSTGRLYGLKQNWWYDGRRDILDSTEAALSYLQKLNSTFNGDWELALAAYNGGMGTVSRAIKRNLHRKKPTDFWSLNLSNETSGYVPKLIALAQIIKDPKHYNIKLTPVLNEPYFAVVHTGGQLDLASAANLGGIPLDELYKLNPGFNRWASDPEGPHRLLIPLPHTEQFQQGLTDLPLEKRIQWQRYIIQQGDSLIKIARQFNTTPEHLMKANHLRNHIIKVNNALLIPQPMLAVNEYSLSVEQRRQSHQSTPVKGKQKTFYVVKPGDSLWRIARQFSVSVNQITQWNHMAEKDPIREGQRLVIWQDSVQLAAFNNQNLSNPNATRKINYQIKSGDSLYQIANKFNVSVNDITQWNTLDKKHPIHPGQQLMLYVDVTNTSAP